MVLKKGYREGMELDEALVLAVKALAKALEVKEPSREKMEFAVFSGAGGTGEAGEEVALELRVLAEADLERLFEEAAEKGAFADGE